MRPTTLFLATLLILTSTALSFVPLAASQPGPAVGDVIATVTESGRYAIDVAAGAGETVLDIVDGLTPTIVNLVASAFEAVIGIAEDVRELIERVRPAIDAVTCVVRDLVTRCDG